jgi:hypothetical protein
MEDLIGKLKEITTDTIKYWERLRIVYNIVLGFIVIVFIVFGMYSDKETNYLQAVFSLFIMAVVANVLYTSAYVPDIFVQLSDYQHTWRKYRWILFLIGLVFAAMNTIKISSIMFVGID